MKYQNIMQGLRDARLVTWRQAAGLAKEAADGNRCFTPAEQAAWDRLNSELAALDARIAKLAAFDSYIRGSRPATEEEARRGYSLSARALTMRELMS